MEKFSLPVLSNNPSRGQEHIQVDKLEVREKIAHAFLRQRYPLTKEGQELRERVYMAVEQKNEQMLQELHSELPTVENPRLHLFADLDIEPQDEERIFGKELANIQITKGCRHKCTFCAAEASDKVEIMPFPAVLKLAEKKHKYDTEIAQTRKEDWGDIIELFKSKGYDFEKEYARIEECLVSAQHEFSDPSWSELCHTMQRYVDILKEKRIDPVCAEYILDCLTQKDALYSSLEEKALALKERVRPTLPACMDADALFIGEGKNKVNLTTYDYMVQRMAASLVRGVDIYPEDAFVRYLRDQSVLTNYYDSDPFDYRDSAFLHEDGTVADFGDVFRALASKERPIHITTAGWPMVDKVAQRGAEKIVEACKQQPFLQFQIRVSINKFELTARQDPKKYLDAMKRVIDTLGPILYQCMIFYKRDHPEKEAPAQEDREFYNYVVKGLVEHGQSSAALVKPYFSFPPISEYHPSHKEESFKGDSQHDVMSCMPGYHIWPDGRLSYQQGLQKDERPAFAGQMTLQGTRPNTTNQRLFKTK